MKRKLHETRPVKSAQRQADCAGSRSPQTAADDGDGTPVRTLNALHTSEFQDRYIDASLLNHSSGVGSTDLTMTIDVKDSAALSREELSSCFGLVETTSRADYEPSSFGWHPRRKRREMLEAEMKYLLVRDAVVGKGEGESVARSPKSVAGFLSFMMTYDSTPSVPVLYIYEVHLGTRLRKIGLGAHLMRLAESVAVQTGVTKVMLTCFLSNEKALAFYRRCGYERDVCSPEDRSTRKKFVKTDYVILSRTVEDISATREVPRRTDTGGGMLSAVRDLDAKLAG